MVAKWKNDPLVRRMALGPGHEATPETELQDIRKALDSERELYLIIELLESGEPLGYIRINWFGEDRRVGWLRFSMGEKRRKGYMRDSLSALFSSLFRDGTRRIDAEVYEFNHASLALLDSLGFVREGIRRKAHFDGSGEFDVTVLGLLSDDPVSRT
jgi:RimJ/RimL family protein N-acetyltransferase